MALRHAYIGEFAKAREFNDEARVIAADLGGLTYGGAMGIHTGHVELLAGDLVAAEREFRRGFDRLGELGETGFRSTIGTMLADALLRQGRDDEAETVLGIAEDLTLHDDIDARVRCRAVRGRLLARRGELVGAERVAREAVEIVSATDYLNLHGDTLLALAEVLEASGAVEEATARVREALELFDRKENVVQAEQTRELIRAKAAV
jgi:tetratricopeptide (TPR) repeat protein